MVSTAGHKKGYENMNSRLPGYRLFIGLSIVTVHRGPERIHSELLNILPLFPCRMYPMDYEGHRLLYVIYGVYAFYTL